MLFNVLSRTFSATTQLSLSTRRQEARTVGRNGWRVLEEEVNWNTAETAIVVVDMWNEHWSWGRDGTCERDGTPVNIVLGRGTRTRNTDYPRPLDTMDFYAEHPARRGDFWNYRTADTPLSVKSRIHPYLLMPRMAAQIPANRWLQSVAPSARSD